MRQLRPRSAFTALLGAWVTLIFLPSLGLAVAEIWPASGADAGRLVTAPRRTFEIADEVGPFAKLSLMAVFSVLALGGELRVRWGCWRYLAHAVLGAAAVALTLAALPAGWSRGFGVGLTGARFDPDVLPIYLLGGGVAGLVFAWVIARPAPSRGRR